MGDIRVRIKRSGYAVAVFERVIISSTVSVQKYLKLSKDRKCSDKQIRVTTRKMPIAESKGANFTFEEPEETW